MQMTQYATHRLDDLPLRAAAYGPRQGQHERVYQWDGQPREITIRNMLSEVMKKPFAPPTVKIERRFPESTVMLKKREVFLEECGDTFRTDAHLRQDDRRLDCRNGRSRN
jgi:hypothetical protein